MIDSPLLNIAVTAARQAGDLISRASQRLDKVNTVIKQHNDFVTQIDTHAERIIIDTIRANYPSHGILGEESGYQEGDDYQWIIDPLDGTTNFIHGFPHYAVSIALKYKGKVEYGVIYDPMRQELFTAMRGKGAYLNNTRLRVSVQKEMEGALLGTGFPIRDPHNLPRYLSMFTAIFNKNIAGIRRAGSAALDLAYVAAGRLDGFWEITLREWDIAAGILLVKEAGGLVSDFMGGEDYFKTGNVVAANPKLFKQILQAIHPFVEVAR